MKRQAVLVVFSLALFLAACDLGIGPGAEPTATTPAAPPPTRAAPAPTSTQPPPVAAATAPPTAVVTVVSSFPTSTRISSSAVGTAVARAKAAATGTALARAGAAPPTTPVTTADVVYVGNTGGLGVFLRRTPQAADRLKAYPDNTRLVVIGPDVGAEGRTWRHVRTPDGVEGYVPAQYTSGQPVPTVTPAPTPPTAAATPTPAPAAPAATYRDATVTNVVNGELVEVSLPGEATRVRLIGIDVPEVVGPGELFQCYGAEATSRAVELLAGQSVRLELDPSQGERDAAGNLLAYIWLQDGSMYNARMIAEGFALERSGAAAYRYQGQFKTAEQQARGQQVGLWHPGSCTGEVPTPTSVPPPPPAPTTAPAPDPTLAVSPLTLSPEQKAAPVAAIKNHPDVLDAVINQGEGRRLGLIITVSPGTSGIRARELGESFVRLVKTIGPDDDPPPDKIGAGRHSYLLRVLELDGKLVTLGEKRWDQERILWIGSVGPPPA